jgi:hypothetical protein
MMSSEVDIKIASALLDEIESYVEKELGNSIAKPFVSSGYDANLDIFCKEMVERCEKAEKKASDNPEIIFRSTVLQAQLYGGIGKKGKAAEVHKKAQ